MKRRNFLKSALLGIPALFVGKALLPEEKTVYKIIEPVRRRTNKPIMMSDQLTRKIWAKKWWREAQTESFFGGTEWSDAQKNTIRKNKRRALVINKI